MLNTGSDHSIHIVCSLIREIIVIANDVTPVVQVWCFATSIVQL